MSHWMHGSEKVRVVRLPQTDYGLGGGAEKKRGYYALSGP